MGTRMPIGNREIRMVVRALEDSMPASRRLKLSHRTGHRTPRVRSEPS